MVSLHCYEDSWLRSFARTLLMFLGLVLWGAALKSTMGHLFYQYNGPYSENPGSRAVDKIQRNLQCCGVQNYTDWLMATTVSWHLPTEKACVPESCCKEKYSHCRGDLCQLEQLFQEGCLRKLEDQMHFVMLAVAESINIPKALVTLCTCVVLCNLMLSVYFWT
uniref:Uncharacterized protein n=1 Tax=Apteryx owenii TaxID=8824 RepID=A0A8B9P4Y4_APTOW